MIFELLFQQFSIVSKLSMGVMVFYYIPCQDVCPADFDMKYH